MRRLATRLYQAVLLARVVANTDVRQLTLLLYQHMTDSVDAHCAAITSVLFDLCTLIKVWENQRKASVLGWGSGKRRHLQPADPRR
jgi:hypothetical protein